MGSKWWHIDVEEMRELWVDGWTADDLAKRFKCPASTVYHLSAMYEWPARDSSNEPPAPSEEDDRLSLDSLALSPWVEARVTEFREAKRAQAEKERVGMIEVRLWQRGRRARV
jgi:hypothetical protein